MSERMTVDEAPEAVREALLAIYKPEGAEIWLNAPHSMLAGHSAADLIRADNLGPVLRVLDALASGAHV